MDLSQLTIQSAHQALRHKEFSAVELTVAYLKQIKKDARQINDFITLNEEFALKQAAQVDKKISQNKKIGYLSGLPYAAKDIFFNSRH